jgi:hypothetical protein
MHYVCIMYVCMYVCMYACMYVTQSDTNLLLEHSAKWLPWMSADMVLLLKLLGNNFSKMH